MNSTVSEGWLQVDGMRIHCLSAGESGSPVLLLHGGGVDCASLSWRPTLGILAPEHRVYAPDLPGYGESDPSRREVSIASYVDFLSQLMDVLGLDRASLVGLSMGGGAAIGFALRAPERVDRLVLVDSYGLGREVPFGVLSYLAIRLPFANEFTWQLMARSRRLTRAALSGIFYNPRALSEPLVDEAFDLVRRPGAAASWMQLQRAELTHRGLQTDFSDRIHRLSVPTLIIHGEQDRLVPLSWAERAQQRIPGARLHILREAGHWSQREQPEEFHRVVSEFLKDS